MNVESTALRTKTHPPKSPGPVERSPDEKGLSGSQEQKLTDEAVPTGKPSWPRIPSSARLTTKP